jgi:hypothetical protein
MALKSGYDDGMEIRYFLEMEDYVAFNMRDQTVQQNIRKTQYFSLSFAVVVFLIGIFLVSPLSPWSNTLLPGVILILGGIAAPILNIRSIPQTFQVQMENHFSTSGMTFPIQVVAKLEDEELVVTSVRGTWRTYYSALVSVVEYPETTYIMFSGIEGHLINHNKVTSGDLKAFIQELATKNPALVPQKGSAKYNFPKS